MNTCIHLFAVLQVIENRFQAGTFYSWAGMQSGANSIKVSHAAVLILC